MSVFIFSISSLILIGIFDNAALACNDILTFVDEIYKHSFWLAIGDKRVLFINEDELLGRHSLIPGIDSIPREASLPTDVDEDPSLGRPPRMNENRHSYADGGVAVSWCFL